MCEAEETRGVGEMGQALRAGRGRASHSSREGAPECSKYRSARPSAGLQRDVTGRQFGDRCLRPAVQTPIPVEVRSHPGEGQQWVGSGWRP